MSPTPVTAPPTAPATRPSAGVIPRQRRRTSRVPQSAPRVRREPVTVPAPVAFANSALWMVALIGAWVVLQVLVLGAVSQTRAQDELYSTFREQLSAGTAPVAAPVEPGAPVAVMRIPEVGVEAVVVSGTSARDLMDGPGHRRDSVLPGQRGVSVIYGRALTYGGPFADLAALEAGTRLQVQTGQGLANFAVDRVRRAGDPLPAPASADEARLTLVTAEGRGVAGRFRPSEVVYVDATLQGDAFAAGPRAAPPAAGESALGTDATALPSLALALGLLAAAVAGVAVAARRWTWPVVWVLGVPVLAALAWWCTDLAMTLLPNLV